MKNQNIVTLILLLVVGVASFYAGTKYQSSKTPSFGGFTNGNRRAVQISGTPNQQFRNRAGFDQIIGEVVSVDSGSVTVKMQDGSTKIVLLTDKTTYNKSQEGNLADVAVGQKVAIFGSSNSDGSVSAQSVQINPVFRQPGISPQPTK